GSATLQRLRAAPVDQRHELLEEFVQSQAAIVLGHQSRAVPRAQGFTDLGMDSLASIELRARLEQALNCRLPATIAFDYPNVEALSAHLMDQVLRGQFREIAPARTAAPNGDGDLENLSRDELAALLAQELSTLEEGKKP